MSQEGSASHEGSHYYVPEPSTWPIKGSIALFFMGFGAAFSVNRLPIGYGLLAIGFAILFYMIFGWFKTVARESEGGKFNKQVDNSFRWGMSWFIFSEVMFFAAFFGALFYLRVFSIPGSGRAWRQNALAGLHGDWPTAGPGISEKFMPMGPWGLPAVNTLILLTSGVTVTWAHWALKLNKRGQLKLGLFLTFALGFLFVGLQAYEYGHAYSDLNLKLTSSVYSGSLELDRRSRAAKIAWLRQEPFRGRRAVFVGDDLTDEQGFITVNDLGGVTVRVGGGLTGAQRRVETPLALRRRLSEWAAQGRIDVDRLSAA